MNESVVDAPPLTGVTVLDLGRLVSGPMVTSILSDFGARVLKVEQPGSPDPMRKIYQKDGVGLWSKVEDRNKEAITLNLKSIRGKAIFEDLLQKVDVLVENFRPGALEKLGLAPDRLLQEVNPKLVVCRISGWGQTGPWGESGRRGFGRTGEAGSGFAYLNGEADGPPMHTAVSLGDTVVALWGAFGVTLALRARDRDGTGQVVDAAMNEGLMRMMVHQIVVKDQLDRTLKRMGNENPGAVTVNMYQTRDGHHFTVSNATPRTQERLVRVVGLDGDPRFASLEDIESNREAFHAHVRTWMAERDIDEVDQLFHDGGAVGTPVWSADEIIEHPQILARKMVISVDDPKLGPIRQPGVFPKLTRTPGQVRHSGQEPGQSNSSVYSEFLGIDESELSELIRDGVV